MTTLTELQIQKLTLRIPEIMAASIRHDQQLTPCYLLDLHFDPHANPDQLAVAPPPSPDDPGWQHIAKDDSFGDPALPALLDWGIQPTGGSLHWLRVVIDVPPAWRGMSDQYADQSVHLSIGRRFIGTDGQSLRYDEGIGYWRGQSIAGFDYYHPTFRLTDPIMGNAEHESFYIRLTAQTCHPFQGVWLALRDDRIYKLGVWMKAALEAAARFNDTDRARHLLRERVNTVYNMLNLRDGWQSTAFAESAYRAYTFLTAHIGDDLTPLDSPHLTVTGHAHLDTAWLWPLWRTRQKAIHTTAAALSLMEQYPEYIFSMSQPAVYDFIEHDDPDLFARIKKHIASGQFEMVGAAWVEPDCNIPSGESLIRQLQHGLRYFDAIAKQTIDAQQHVLWLPDVFGYSAALPQILRGFGIDVFMTSKISWNQFNRLPFETFKWRGIDGSEVLTHFVTTSAAPVGKPNETQFFTYNGNIEAGEVQGAWAHYQQKALNDDILFITGWGDGGGGPTEDMLETRRALESIPGFPRPQFGTVENYFKNLYAKVWNNPELPRWVGELYLEYHRGTYTSQARTKHNNRQAELKLREVSWLNTWSVLLGGVDQQAIIDECWKTVLLNQFHDILPGSSIHRVYEDSEAQFAAMFATLDQVDATALQTISAHTGRGVINTLGWKWYEPAKIPLSEVVDNEFSEPVVTQQINEYGQDYLLVELENAVPAFGFQRLPIEPGEYYYTDDQEPTVDETTRRLENPHLRVVFDENGEISSMYDKDLDREIVLPGQTLNQLVCYEDRPLNFQAWDIDAFYTEKAYPVRDLVSFRVVESGPLSAAIEIVRTFGKSRITQRITLRHWAGSLRFHTHIDWHEHDTLLKALFPLNLNVTTATCEIQFGAVQRPTHRNTSWDTARFEVCAHRWVDLSEADYGVTLMNTGKYGHSFDGSTIGLSLLKGATHPDPDADQGEHTFTYSLSSHYSTWADRGIPKSAYSLNVPLRYIAGTGSGTGKTELCMFKWARDNADVIIETIKTAPVTTGKSCIMRIYEPYNQRSSQLLQSHFAVTRAALLDLREREIAPLEVTDGHNIDMEFRPYEIKTVQLWFE